MTELIEDTNTYAPPPPSLGPGPHFTAQKMLHTILKEREKKKIRKGTKDHIFPTSEKVNKLYGH